MNNKAIIAGFLLVLGVIIAGLTTLSMRIDSLTSALTDISGQIQAIPGTLGASSGMTHSNPEQFIDQLFVSRVGNLNAGLPGIATTTEPASSTGITAGQFTWKTVCENNVIDLSLGAAGNIVLPSSTVIFNNCLKRIGDSRTFFVWNASGTPITFSISDQSSTIKSLLNSTTSLNVKDFAEIRAIRVNSSTATSATNTTPWLYWVINTQR